MKLINLFSSKYINYFLIFFYFIITLLLYYNSIDNFFVLDDFVRLKVISEGSLHENFHFIPVPLLLYRAVYSLWGMDPAPYRIMFFIINAFFCFFLYKTAILIYRHLIDERYKIYVNQLAFLTSIFFCVHFIHVETVIYFSELHELLYSLFFLLAFYLYLNYKYNKKDYLYYLIFPVFTLCILSKETAITFIPLIILCEYFLFDEKILQVLKKYWGLFLISLLFLLFRIVLFPNLDNLQTNFSLIPIFKETIKNIIFTFTAFIFSLDYSLIKIIYKSFDINYFQVFAELYKKYPVALLAVFASFIFYFLTLKKKSKLNIFSIIFILITSSSYLWLAGYERYLYLPSVGFWILTVNFLFINNKLINLKQLKYLIVILILSYNVYNLKIKEQNWINASIISKTIVTDIINSTGNLPDNSVVFFKDLPGEYNGAWILRFGIHQIPELFMTNNRIKFYYYYEYETGNYSGNNIYIYEYTLKTLNKIN